MEEMEGVFVQTSANDAVEEGVLNGDSGVGGATAAMPGAERIGFETAQMADVVVETIFIDGAGDKALNRGSGVGRATATTWNGEMVGVETAKKEDVIVQASVGDVAEVGALNESSRVKSAKSDMVGVMASVSKAVAVHAGVNDAAEDGGVSEGRVTDGACIGESGAADAILGSRLVDDISKSVAEVPSSQSGKCDGEDGNANAKISDRVSDIDSDSSDSSSCSSSSSSSSSSDSSGDAERERVKRALALAEAEANMESSAPARTKNEKDESNVRVAPVAVEVNDAHSLVPVGRVKSIMSKAVVVESLPGALCTPAGPVNPFARKRDDELSNVRALDADTVLVLTEKRVAFGRVFETFGPVTSPFYIVRFNSDEEVDALKPALAVGNEVSFIAGLSHLVCAGDIRDRGYDSSNLHDEELTCNRDHSDDEAEVMSKKAKKRSIAEARPQKAHGPGGTAGLGRGARPAKRMQGQYCSERRPSSSRRGQHMPFNHGSSQEAPHFQASSRGAPASSGSHLQPPPPIGPPMFQNGAPVPSIHPMLAHQNQRHMLPHQLPMQDGGPARAPGHSPQPLWAQQSPSSSAPHFRSQPAINPQPAFGPNDSRFPPGAPGPHMQMGYRGMIPSGSYGGGPAYSQGAQPGMQTHGRQRTGMQAQSRQQPGMQAPGMQLPPGMQRLHGMQSPGMLSSRFHPPGMQQPNMQQPTTQWGPGMGPGMQSYPFQPYGQPPAFPAFSSMQGLPGEMGSLPQSNSRSGSAGQNNGMSWQDDLNSNQIQNTHVRGAPPGPPQQ